MIVFCVCTTGHGRTWALCKSLCNLNNKPSPHPLLEQSFVDAGSSDVMVGARAAAGDGQIEERSELPEWQRLLVAPWPGRVLSGAHTEGPPGEGCDLSCIFHLVGTLVRAFCSSREQTSFLQLHRAYTLAPSGRLRCCLGRVGRALLREKN